MKHKHFDLITAAAENLSLVIFCKTDAPEAEWFAMESFPNWLEEYSYFLCLPQHKEVCLHWLNGGEAISASTDARDGAIHAYNGTWSCNHYFMSSVHTMRIKPKKEKRWIGYCASRNQTFPHPQKSKELAWDYAATHYQYHTSEWQVIEIEVEVK